MRSYLRALAVTLALLHAGAAAADEWKLTIATWNLLNMGNGKAGLRPYGPLNNALLDRYANIISQFDIVVLQEILDTGAPLTTAIAERPQLALYNCQTVSDPSGRAGRQERYGICYAMNKVVMNGTFDFMAPGTTANPFQTPPATQPTQNVWMRPPLSATFTYTLDDGTPFTFQLVASHTKPSYSKGAGRPAGTPANAPKSSSVYYELWATQNNPVPATPAGTPIAVLGDLNADCASYPVLYRGTNFTAASGWSWYPANYGDKTNTAPGSSCAYDRIILNDALNQYYLGDGIYQLGINERINNRRVSDHYLAWVELGEDDSYETNLSVAATTSVQNPAKLFKAGTGVAMLASGVSAGISKGDLYVIGYNAAMDLEGNQSYTLTDVRGAPSPVTFTNGSYTTNPTWGSPVAGAYKMVIDVNGNGVYLESDGDIANQNGQIDFLVTGSSPPHSNVVTIGGNGRLQELFNSSVAQNVYAAAFGLPATTPVDLYVVSTSLLPATFPGWAAAIQQGRLELSSVSAPVNVTTGPLMIPDVTPADQLQTVTTGPDGSLFTSVWQMPATLFGMAALSSTPAVPVYEPDYDDEDVCDTFGIFEGCDPCLNAISSADTNFQAVCNVWPSFSDYYGNDFNVVVDVNRNGILDSPDVVDVHDIGDLTTWFASHTVLDASANGNAAVGEWKEFLDSKLNLTSPLPPGNTYDAATMIASRLYLCSPTVPVAMLPILTENAQVGFVILDQVEYLMAQTLPGGTEVYDELILDDVTLSANAQTCVVSNVTTVDDLTVPTGSTATFQANEFFIVGDVTTSPNSTVCMMAEQGWAMTAAGAAITIAAPGPITPFAAGGTVVLGLLSTIESAACYLTQ